MGFFDTLRRVLSGDRLPQAPSPATGAPWPAPGVEPAPAAGAAPTPGPEAYDRVQWHKKLKRILNELPASQGDWPDLMAEARALGFEAGWVRQCQVDEFQMMIRRAVSDRQFTEDEHRRIDLARDLIGLAEPEAEAIVHAIVAEAEAFFGKPVEET